MNKEMIENAGSFIKFYRTKKGITQESLSQGICSITYLSKIENGKITPNQETVKFLLERLDLNTVEYAKLLDNMHTVEELITKIYVLIEGKKNEEVRKIFNDINQQLELIMNNPTLFQKYLLVKLRYHLIFNELNKAQKAVDDIESMKDMLTPLLKQHYYHFKGLLKCRQNLYNEGLFLLKEAESIMMNNNRNDCNLLYHIGLTYSHLKISNVAIHYCQKALPIFIENMNFNKIIDCKSIIGLNYTRNMNYEEAEKEFLTIVRISMDTNDQVNRAIAYHNLGYCYSMRENHNKAMEYYTLSLELKDSKSQSYFTTLLYIVKHLYRNGKLDECNRYLERALRNMRIKDFSGVEIDFVTLWYEVNLERKNNIQEYIIHLEKTAVPYYISKQNFQELSKAYRRLGEYYYNDRKYKLACNYYERAIKSYNEEIISRP
ncbi:tetratricopeptide (TPR) repeat protein [Bacillus mesophilus]|uniref:Helix-turn-helix transcriptional regulator n=1 Tax=Bacillus mesophilus TaxID=1808955 RepID=A0A6M0Q9Q5_9BACI|nr:helix-turn-helix transcriptional regulator [Bacillus mesophilus]MBM7662285.1 tetratricopeptide (TPR) repeat protein [Bacillus mesophilus]NEY73082.1 helix-turn-helix transcriptional regulator [Bacillus mesophilus]